MFYTIAYHSVSLATLSGVLLALYLSGLQVLLWLGSLAASLACLLYVSYQVGSFLDNFLSRFRVKPANKAVFITADAMVWDRIQADWYCCGADGPGDYKEVPNSCCGAGKSSCDAKSAFQEGCYKKMEAFVDKNVKTFAIIITVICLLEVVAATMAFCLASNIRKGGKWASTPRREHPVSGEN